MDTPIAKQTYFQKQKSVAICILVSLTLIFYTLYVYYQGFPCAASVIFVLGVLPFICLSVILGLTGSKKFMALKALLMIPVAILYIFTPIQGTYWC